MIRPENTRDVDAIASVISEAFLSAEHSGGNEAQIVSDLRADGALDVSLVAEIDGDIVGHVAFSPIQIDWQYCYWYGLAPVSVLPRYQRGGIGAALINAGLGLLRAKATGGCVVLGDPRYYSRFGFTADGRLKLKGVPPEAFQSLAFATGEMSGVVTYHQALS